MGRSRAQRLRRVALPRLAIGLAVLLLVWVLLSPAEARLGSLVKLVYVHGALVWVGLMTFTLAGGLGAVALLVRRGAWYWGTEAAGVAALWIWVVYAISAMVVTGLTWGQIVAWNEPRVRATGLILLAAAIMSLTVRLVDHRDFRAAVNMAMGILPWIVVRRAEVIRHPADPIGGSGSAAIQLYYALIVATMAALALVLVAYIWLGQASKEPES